MTIAQLIQLATNRLAYLNVHRSLALDRGDVSELVVIDAEIATTEATLAQLQSL